MAANALFSSRHAIFHAEVAVPSRLSYQGCYQHW